MSLFGGYLVMSVVPLFYRVVALSKNGTDLKKKAIYTTLFLLLLYFFYLKEAQAPFMHNFIALLPNLVSLPNLVVESLLVLLIQRQL